MLLIIQKHDFLRVKMKRLYNTININKINISCRCNKIFQRLKLSHQVKNKKLKRLLIVLENQTIQFYKDTQSMSRISLEVKIYFIRDRFLITINIKETLEIRSLSQEFEKEVSYFRKRNSKIN
ncbi:unnamed protein product [Paramecium sonneborni]|uniref:Uncharacterized protein n=1 Tax=Paramecium sonneborni TaxID=65129 RepID=A0A8S1NS66_9CILI|nr:unnamed protein product [Paramecium sonneborni]